MPQYYDTGHEGRLFSKHFALPKVGMDSEIWGSMGREEVPIT